MPLSQFFIALYVFAVAVILSPEMANAQDSKRPALTTVEVTCRFRGSNNETLSGRRTGVSSCNDGETEVVSVVECKTGQTLPAKRSELIASPTGCGGARGDREIASFPATIVGVASANVTLEYKSTSGALATIKIENGALDQSAKTIPSVGDKVFVTGGDRLYSKDWLGTGTGDCSKLDKASACSVAVMKQDEFQKRFGTTIGTFEK